jgi:2-polyprenyl-3-methyl-5-hydroxy-6-metoxy-1,4-benzoquinol methylase
MDTKINYTEINRELWNAKTAVHLKSDFYNLPGFLKGETSLKSIELEMLGDISGKSVLHLQCHFGQDSISLARMGANVTAVDLSDQALKKGRELAIETKTQVTFIESDVLKLIGKIDQKFDIVFASYGCVAWLDDLDKWAKTVSHHMKPGGKFVFVESHPVLWMMDEAVDQVKYSYFKAEPFVELETSSYTDSSNHKELQSVSWNHSFSEVLNALLRHRISIQQFDEFDYFPYPIFEDGTETEKGRFRPKTHGDKLPLTYALLGSKD